MIGYEIRDNASICIGALNHAGQAAHALCPVQRQQVILDRQHGRSVDRLAFKDTLDQLAAFGQAENLRQGPRGRIRFKALHSPRGEHDHAMRRLAAQHLLPAERGDIEAIPRQILRKGGRGGIADRQARALGLDPIPIRHTHPGSGAVPGENHVIIRIDATQIDNLAVVGNLHLGIELQLLYRIGDPARAKGFPSQHFHLARPQKRPHRHFHCPRIRGGHDPDPVVMWDVQNCTCAVNCSFQPLLAYGRTVTAAQRGT